MRPGRRAAAVRGAGRHQGPAVRDGGAPDDGGQRRLRRLGRRPRQRARAPPARGGRDRRRQDQHARGRHAAGHRERPLRRDAQPLGSRALARRLVGRERGRRRLGHGGARRRQRPGRLDPHPGRLLRARRPEAQPGAGLDRPRPRRRRARGRPPTACSPGRSSTRRSRSTRSPATSRATATTPRLRPTSFADAARSSPGRLQGAPLPRGAVRRAGRRGAGRGGDGRRRARSASLGHEVGEWTTALGRRVVPRRAGRPSRRGTVPAPGARPRAPARPAGRPGEARAGDPRVAARHAADAARRLPRGRRAPVGVRPADPGRVGARRGAAHPDAHPAAGARRRDAIAGRRHRRRRPLQRARADLERDRAAGDQPALRQTADGVPVGVQLVGAHGRDHLLLGVAAQLEAAVGWKPAGRPAV